VATAAGTAPRGQATGRWGPANANSIPAFGGPGTANPGRVADTTTGGIDPARGRVSLGMGVLLPDAALVHAQGNRDEDD
jgi:hypothetical protein